MSGAGPIRAAPIRAAALAALAALPLLAGAARANDSSAVLGAGGIELVSNADVALLREDLSISVDQIRVRYEFRNEGPQDVDTLVAFPLPDLDTAQLFEASVDAVPDEPVNFVGFRVKVDGRDVTPVPEVRAMVGGQDVTALLRQYGVAISPFEADFYAVSELTGPALDALAQAGAVDTRYGVFPAWTVKTVFTWRQVFPAGRTVVVEHSYRPVAGFRFYSDTDAETLGRPGDEWTETYCIDKGTERAIRALIAQRHDYGVLATRSVDYILTTANNWRGPIGTFHLTIDKGRPGNVVSLCFDGDLAKTGPTTFEATLHDFTPRRDLEILIVSPPET